MGQPRFLPCGLTLLLLLAGCGADAGLLGEADVEQVYSGGTGGGSYAPTSKDPSSFGTISGKVTYEGRRRRRKEGLYKEYCINANPNGLLSEDFLVGPQGELGGALVYVKRGLSRMAFPAPQDPVLLDQKACRYLPHLAVLQFGQQLVIRNSDQHEHNVHGMPGVNGEFNVPMNRPASLDPMTFSKQQVAMSVKCDIHGWMQSYVAILPHPCWAITAKDGSFTIRGVPPGTFVLAVWHEELGELTTDITRARGEDSTQAFSFPAKP